jgi:nitroreductase
MGVYGTILKRRTIRRFAEKPVPISLLKKCVNAARLSPNARNAQPLEFVAVNEKGQLARMNEAVHFGGSVKEKGRVRGEEPKAFIVIVADKAKTDEKYLGMDTGIAAEAIVLTAFEKGVAGCMMGAIERERIKGVLGIPNWFDVQLAVALGYPKEKAVAEDETRGIPCGVDKKGIMHVDKRPLEKVLHKNRF